MRRIVSCVGICSIEATKKLLHAVLAKGYEAYHWAVSRTRPEYLDPDPSDCSVAVREDPDEEEEEDKDKGDGKEDDDDDDEDDDGYSE
jgi:hypothetical protein